MAKLILLLALLLALPAGAMPTFNRSSQPREVEEAELAVRREQWPAVIRLLEPFVRQEPAHADAHNMLGFAYRKLGRYEEAGRAYRTALEIEPEHRQALEYYGELFLALKDLPRAEEQLGKLVRLCPRGCEERHMLEAAIKKYKAE